MKGWLSLDAALLRADSPTEEAGSFFVQWFSTLLHNGIIWRGSKRPYALAHPNQSESGDRDSPGDISM